MSLALRAFLAGCSALGLANSAVLFGALLGRAVLLVPRHCFPLLREPGLAPHSFLGVGSSCWTLPVSLRLRDCLGGAGSRYTVKTFGLLQPYFGCLSCMPDVCVTHYRVGYQSHSESECS